jgi:PmbA protein
MKENNNLFNLGEYGLRFTEKFDKIKCSEFYIQERKSFEVGIEKNSIKDCNKLESNGFSIRVFDKRGSLGFAYANDISKKIIEKTINIAVKMMIAGPSNDEFRDLPFPKKSYPKISGIYDKNIKNLDLEKPFELIGDMIKISSQDSQFITQSGGFSSIYTKYYIFNSNGVEISSKETGATLSSSILVKNKKKIETGNGFDWQIERNFKDLDPINVIKKSLHMAKMNLNRIRVKAMKVPLILTPKGVINLILTPLSSAINAETFQYNRSFLIGQLNQKIGSDLLNIEDNALINGAIGSSSNDAEGVPCKNKKIFENGVFLSLLHNSFTANKDNVENTGNAQRSSFYSTPYISPSNLIFNKGNYKKIELIEDIKEGIILDYTGDSPNLATGDFSGLILNGNLIKDGEIQESLNETMIGINILDLLKNIEKVSSDTEVYGSLVAPCVKISNVQISGSK